MLDSCFARLEDRAPGQTCRAGWRRRRQSATARPRPHRRGRPPRMMTCRAPPMRSSCMSAWRLHQMACCASKRALAWRRPQGRCRALSVLLGSRQRLHAAIAGSRCAERIPLIHSLPWLPMALQQAAHRGSAASGVLSGPPNRMRKEPLRAGRTAAMQIPVPRRCAGWMRWCGKWARCLALGRCESCLLRACLCTPRTSQCMLKRCIALGCAIAHLNCMSLLPPAHKC